jgi:hypothetical protein
MTGSLINLKEAGLMRYRALAISHTVVICSAVAGIMYFSELSSIGKPISDLIGSAIFVPSAFVIMLAINIGFNRSERARSSEAGSGLADGASRNRAFLGARLPEGFVKLQTRTSFVAILAGIFIVSLSLAPLELRVALFAILCLYQVITFCRFICAPRG